VLVTGASGVVGTAILRELAGYEVLAAAYRRLPAGSSRVVQIDLTSPLLGLDPAAYRRLCAEVDVVVHSAAIVNFSAHADEVGRVNVEGLGRIVEFAAEADAPLVHISTAFVARHAERDPALRSAAKTSARPDEYVASKHAGEQIVTGSGIDAVILRPSVVIGDSATGEIRQHQGVHMLGEAVLRGTIPFIPAAEESYIDVVPTDVVGRAVRCVLDADLRSGDFWLTNGENALPVPRYLELTTEVGRAAGLEVPATRIMEPSIVDRLVRPAFDDVLSAEELGKLDGLLAVCSLVMTDTQMPSSLGEIPGCGPMSREFVEEAWRVSARRLIETLRLAPARQAA
jgi:nucleoside-diphosphate-sugar epimerase